MYFDQDEQKLFDAVWQWVLDHSDMTGNGTLFLKAHIKNKKGFYNSIRYRIKGKYRQVLDESILDIRREEHIDKSTQGVIAKAIKEVGQKNLEMLSKKKRWWHFIYK